MQPQFRAGLDRLIDAAAQSRVCLMCAEREPLDCHRCLLVARSLAERGSRRRPHPARRHDRAARRDRTAAAGAHGDERRPVRGWTERATRGSVSSPRAALSHSGKKVRRRVARRRSRRCGSRSPVAGADARRVGPALAQDPGTLDKKPLPPLAIPIRRRRRRRNCSRARPNRRRSPPARSASTPHGCLAGAVALPINGPTWQVMRLSRNRNWGHPKLIAFLERLGDKAKKIGWNGLLVGDMSQPRGGPMLTGHASHQVGLDADIWFTPMPDRKLSREEREFMSATKWSRPDRLDVDPKVWTPRAHRADPHRGGGSRGRAHLRQCGDQEGAVPRGRH